MEYPCKKSTSSGSKLRHRFAQLLLGSSCTTTIAASTVVGQTKPPTATPTHPAAADLDLDFDSRNRRKLDLHSPFSSVAATDRRLRRVAPLVHVSIDCGARRSVEVSERYALLPSIPTAAAEAARPRKLYGATRPRKKKVACERKKKKKTAWVAEAKMPLLSNAYGFTSSSSFDSEKIELGLFSSDDEDDDEEEEEEDEEERAALFSSKSFSSDSSEFYHRSRQNKNRPTQRCKSMKSTRRPPPLPPRRRHVREHSCGAIDQLRPLVSISTPRPPEPNKEKPPRLPPPPPQPAAGFAVVKRSSDPYGDFRSSMVDMIVDRGMSRGSDLERLLHSYLTLNSPCHHPAILEAFGDVWEAIFSK